MKFTLTKTVCLILSSLNLSFLPPSNQDHAWDSSLMTYTLITPDYGILTNEDIETEANFGAIPAPLILNEVSGALVWQCLPTREVSMQCDTELLDSSYHVQYYEPVLEIIDNGRLYEFNTRRAWDGERCLEDMAKWKDAIDGEEVVCISASYTSEWPEDMSPGIDRHSLWEINRVKSAHGKWSYWPD